MPAPILRRKLAVLTVAIAAILLPGPLWADDLEAGRALSEQWCQACHLIEPGQQQAADAAPSFSEIANDPATTRAGLQAWLFDPHPPMPKLDLTRREIDDLTAYILSLAPK